MTNEEWDRKAEFLLNQQAKFDAGMEKLKEAQEKSQQTLERANENNRTPCRLHSRGVWTHPDPF